MPRILLVLPGSTDFDENGRIQGTLDIPLSEEGSREVARLAAELKERSIEAVYASQGEPAKSTAQTIAAALGVRFKPLEELDNLNHGLWQGMLVDDVRRKQPKVYRQWQEQPDSVHPPEGETLAEAGDRVESALRKLLRKHRDGTFAVVVPEPLASIVRERLGGVEIGDLWRACASRHGCWEAFDVSGNCLDDQPAEAPAARHGD